MKIYLAVFLKYMDFNETRMNLCEFDSVKELDDFTTNFNDSGEIKKKYQRDIQEFLLDNRKNYAYSETKNGVPKVTLSAYYIENNEIHYLTTIYKKQNSSKIKLLTINELIQVITVILKKTKKLIEQENKFLSSNDIQRYLNELAFLRLSFSEHSLSYLKKYIANIGGDWYLKEFLNTVRVYLNNLNKNQLYEISRIKVKELERIKLFNNHDFKMKNSNFGCGNDVQIKTTKGTIRNISIPLEKTKLVRDRIHDNCDDDFFMSLLDKGDYEELFNNYSVDEILKYSNDDDNPLGLRR